MVGLPSVYGSLVKILSEGEDFQRCPTCGEAIVYGACLDRFHDQEPEGYVDAKDRKMYDALMEANLKLMRILGGF